MSINAEKSESPLKRALRAVEDMQTKLEAIEYSRQEPIAIIGIGCRYPGGISNPETFWNLVSGGVDAISEIPQDRWNIEEYYDSNPETPGKMYTRHGGFIEELKGFDPSFFGISGKEATYLDPQQRMLLEVSWESLENAAINPSELAKTQTGVFIGICGNDYTQLASSKPEEINPYFASGNAHSSASGRLSYFLGLTGPNMAVDTACSSSLVSVHLACTSLRNQECNLALAGGVNRLISPLTHINHSRARMLSPDGRCKAFDAKADGFVRSEGCGIIVLKRLSDAVADGDNILAVIRGTALNQDGRTSGLTVPNGPSQQAVIRKALQNGEVNPSEVSYIEAHGTGTSLGDPIEVGALGAVFGFNHSPENPLYIGSVKTNFGHAEAAAGIAGLIKVVLQLQHGKIAPHLHFQEPNSQIDWAKLPIQVPTKTIPWEVKDNSRIAGVSSFGFSGTNAHLVLQEVPTEEQQEQTTGNSQDGLEHPYHILTLSAQTEKALNELVERYQTHLQTHPELLLADIAYTTNIGREHFNHRLGIIASSRSELVEKLDQFKIGEEFPGIASGNSNSGMTPKVAFLFTGQGSQYINMGKYLYETEPIFRETCNLCDRLLQNELDYSVLETIYPKSEDGEKTSLLDQTAYTQPALFVIEYALCQLWRSWGINPSVLMGHSVGEYVAATVAGVLSLKDGLKLIAARGKLMQQLPSGGEMVSVMASESKVRELIVDGANVAIAAINGPESVVISGEREALGAIVSTLESEGIKTKKLEVSHAFHSPLMEPMLQEFEAVARQLRYFPPQIPIVSNVTGKRADKSITSYQYWVDHVCQPVRFADSMETLHQEGYEIFLEIGPKPILLGMGRQCLPEDGGAWLPSLRPGVDEWQQMFSSLAQLYVRGVKIDWFRVHQQLVLQKVVLPTYPFQRKNYWIDVKEDKRDSSLLDYSPILNLIHQGNTEELAQELNLAGILSDKETEVLPKLLSLLVDRHQNHLQFKGNIVHDYYNSAIALSQEQKSHNRSLQFLTFGIFPEIVPEFSWAKLSITPDVENTEFYQMTLTAQKKLRELCFLQVDFLESETVLDFGCGYASDLISLAQKYPHLRLNGYTISTEQAKFGTQQVKDYELEKQVRIFNRDSSKDEFPDDYNVAFGFEVAHHIRNKSDLFSNISRHLRQEGVLVMADFIARGNVDIDHEETSSYFITKEHWVEQLSQQKLQLTGFIDISQEIANFLYAPDFDDILNELYEQNPDDNVRAAFQSYNQLGKLLQKGLASYVLLTAKKYEQKSTEELYLLNQEAFNNPVFYSEIEPEEWLYEVTWKPTKDREINGGEISEKSGKWLIFSEPNTIITQELIERLNNNCILVSPGVNYQKINSQQYEINPEEPNLFHQLLEDIYSQENHIEGVVYLGSLQTSIDDLDKSMETGCTSLLYLVQALVSQPKFSGKLFLVTQDSQCVDISSPVKQPQQAAIWGMGKVITLEHPEFQCRCIDLEATQTPQKSAEVLAMEVLHPDSEEQIAFNNGVRHVARLAHRRQTSSSKEGELIELNSEASYLITGGLGALGLEVAQWMVKQGAKYIVLIGRNAPSTQAQEIIDELEKNGAQVSILQGDIAQEEDVARILEKIKQSLPELKGVVHAAGVLADGVLQKMDGEQLNKVMAPKVQGSWYLHQLTKNLPLDFFVCFSSVASVFGSSGQGNYAAANAFMDALAHYRRGLGLPGLSINWGVWGKVGMAARLSQEQKSRIQINGMGAIAPEQGLQIFSELLSEPISQIAVCSVNWPQLFQQLPSGVKIPLLEDFASALSKTETDTFTVLEQLKNSSQQERKTVLIDYLKSQIARVLEMPISEIDINQSLTMMGVDSLMAIELRNRFNAQLEVDVPSTRFIEGVTIMVLSDEINEQISQKIDLGDRPSPEPKTDKPVNRIQGTL